jgi:protein phosphatase PTC2/3
MERVCENTVSVELKQTKSNNFVPFIRSGEWSNIGGRDYMEHAHVCISDLAKNFGSNSADDEVISFYGVITCSLLNIQSILRQGNHVLWFF